MANYIILEGRVYDTSVLYWLYPLYNRIIWYSIFRTLFLFDVTDEASFTVAVCFVFFFFVNYFLCACLVLFTRSYVLFDLHVSAAAYCCLCSYVVWLIFHPVLSLASCLLNTHLFVIDKVILVMASCLLNAHLFVIDNVTLTSYILHWISFAILLSKFWHFNSWEVN